MNRESNPFIGTSVSPPERNKKIYMSRCPGCGFGPYLRYIGGPALCSDECEKRLIAKQRPGLRPAEKRANKKKLKRLRRAEKAAAKKQKRQEKINAHINRMVEEKVKSLKGFHKPEVLTPLQKRFGKTFYTSREWIGLRYMAIKKHGASCQACGRSKAQHGIVLHVDHIKPRSKYPELELDITNLQVLCSDCNLGKSNVDETDWRRI